MLRGWHLCTSSVLQFSFQPKFTALHSKIYGAFIFNSFYIFRVIETFLLPKLIRGKDFHVNTILGALREHRTDGKLSDPHRNISKKLQNCKLFSRSHCRFGATCDVEVFQSTSEQTQSAQWPRKKKKQTSEICPKSKAEKRQEEKELLRPEYPLRRRKLSYFMMFGLGRNESIKNFSK